MEEFCNLRFAVGVDTGSIRASSWKDTIGATRCSLVDAEGQLKLVLVYYTDEAVSVFLGTEALPCPHALAYRLRIPGNTHRVNG